MQACPWDFLMVSVQKSLAMESNLLPGPHNYLGLIRHFAVPEIQFMGP